MDEVIEGAGSKRRDRRLHGWPPRRQDDESRGAGPLDRFEDLQPAHGGHRLLRKDDVDRGDPDKLNNLRTRRSQKNPRGFRSGMAWNSQWFRKHGGILFQQLCVPVGEDDLPTCREHVLLSEWIWVLRFPELQDHIENIDAPG